MFVAIVVSCTGCNQSISDALYEFYYDEIYGSFFQTYFTASGVESYGIIDGNGTDVRAKELFAILFPPEIKDSFQDITYEYKAAGLDSWSFEIYLEFVLEDSAEFQEYVNGIAPSESWLPFEYDETYLEYIYSDWYDAKYHVPEDYYSIDSAEIAKILINTEEQRIITVALGVHDGGAAEAYDFTVFFDRFQIDPMEYTKRPDYNHEEILNGEHLAPNQDGWRTEQQDMGRFSST